MEWMWEPFHVGLEPQPMHKGFIRCAPVNQDFSSYFPNLGQQVWGHEYYSLVRGTKSEPFDVNGRETDLFAGVTPA